MKIKIKQKYKIVKNIFLLFIWYILNSKYTFWWSIQDDIIPTQDTAIYDNEFDEWYTTFILTYIRDSIFELLMLITIWVFIFIWARLVMARWNPEEFKKALMQFIYAIVWLAIVAIAWAAVKIVSSLDF